MKVYNDVYISCGARRESSLGAKFGDVRKVSHLFGLNVSKTLSNHPAIY